MTNATKDTQQLTDVSDMYTVHKVFRREFVLIPQIVRRVEAGDTARATEVGEYARLILAGLHMHHTGEDAMLWPLLLERDAPDAELIRRMETQHSRVEALIEQLGDSLTRWEAEARPAVREEVASTFDEFREALFEHLDDEERYILPIAARCITQEEWNAVGEHGTSTMTKAQLPLMFGALLEDATPEERKFMLALVPAPARLLLRTVFAWQYKRRVNRVRNA